MFCMIPCVRNAWDGGEMMAQWYMVSFWVDENTQTSDKGLLSIIYEEYENTKIDSGWWWPNSVNILKSTVCTRGCSVVSDPLWPHGLQPARLLCPWDFPGKNTGLGYHFLLQGICLTQRLNPCLLHLLHWQVDTLPLSHLRSPQNHSILKKKPLCGNNLTSHFFSISV